MFVRFNEPVDINGVKVFYTKGDHVDYARNTWRGPGILIKLKDEWIFVPISNVIYAKETHDHS